MSIFAIYTFQKFLDVFNFLIFLYQHNSTVHNFANIPKKYSNKVYIYN